jgi:hypothetical protein
MAVMARPKRPGDRHKTQAFQLRLHTLLRKQLEKLADRNLTTITAEVIAAIRKHLEDNGLWPVEGGKS